MIVVATDDFALYHEVVGELRDRGAAFTTVEPDEAIPEGTRAVVRGEGDPPTGAEVREIVASASDARGAVDEALSVLRDGGRTVVGVDPGERPGVAVLSGRTVVAAFHVPPEAAVERIREEVADAASPLVRVGDGARHSRARLVEALDDVPVELVDETGTTPHLGTGTRGMGDVLAAVNIARREGDRVDSAAVDPTPGELQRIKAESRRRSAGDRTIDEGLARRVATGDLTVDEALAEHEGG